MASNNGHLRPGIPATIEAFQRQFLPGRRVLLPAPPRPQNPHSQEEVVAAYALLDLWKSQLVFQAPQPDMIPPLVTPQTVFYAAGRPSVPERRDFEGIAELSNFCSRYRRLIFQSS